MVHLTRGNILEADTEAVVNTVNCVGVMGKGIALQFKQAYPENFRAYREACQAGEVVPGRMFVVPTGHLTGPKYIINFPTKRHWRSPSRLDDVHAGLAALVGEIQRLGLRSVAIPPLGCGNGGLDWEIVRPLIQSAMDALPQVAVQLYEPAGAPPATAMPVGTTLPELTRRRAMLVGALDGYLKPGYEAGRLVIQKLCYFLQEAGEPLGLEFTKATYGPYAEAVNPFVLELEGHFLRGYGDRSGPSEVRLTTGAVEAASAIIEPIPEARRRLDRVSELIDGFETPYGMELLATTHWVATRDDPRAATDPAAAVAGVQSWSERKRDYLRVEHVEVAWQRLSQQGWLDSRSMG